MMRSVYALIAKEEERQEKIGHTIGVRSLEVKWRCGVGNGINALDSFVKCTIFGNILDNDELKSLPVMGEFIIEEGAFR
jgi:hypothetical protein